ncbi:hypothetical protein DCS_03421 [Drechmeria coniospora]|uniref:FAD-binding PCMH-type domain-containing protein n=1 Tax=Drechmeria coniospora TaxID=98403 RepID=A0A151GH98_DRECN|nr:hypothetical protein DCS_03421 [Drechmeria coniospora]KYK56421.1 hypothetical protein DCS_03421 [Drechmeria coniospora]
MDRGTWQATVGAGIRLGTLARRLHDEGGRAISHGTSPNIGIGGHATVVGRSLARPPLAPRPSPCRACDAHHRIRRRQGGLGPMSRMWGTTLDHVLSVEVVTSDGAVRTANVTTNGDLFWALRGAGGSFGIVTQLTLRTRPEPTQVVQYRYRFVDDTPDGMTGLLMAWQALAADPRLDRRFHTRFVAHAHGVVILATFYGSMMEFAASGLVARLPQGDMADTQVVDWLDHLHDEAGRSSMYLGDLPSYFYSRSFAFHEKNLPRGYDMESMFYHAAGHKARAPWYIVFSSEGGAVADVADKATAYPHRDKVVMYQAFVVGPSRLPAGSRRFVDGVHRCIKATGVGTTYAGHVDLALDGRSGPKAYWGHKLARLRQIKHLWDGRDIFRNPQSIEPEERR